MMKRMHHIGILVEDLDPTIKKFEGFGLTCTEVIERSEQGMRMAFFPVGETLIEFVSFSPDKEQDHLLTVVQSQKGTINHLCFEVDDLEASIRDFEKSGAKLIEGSPRAAAHGRIAFFYPETTEGVLIELLGV